MFFASFKASKPTMPSPSVPSGVFKPDNLYALVIGINNYPDPDNLGWRSLRGAIPDAEAFKGFLTDTLKVPKQHVRYMQDADRQSIVSTLESLKRGKLLLDGSETLTIPNDAAFVLFYAGHGGRTRIPATWKQAGYRTADNKVEVLVPTDIGKLDANGRKVVGIPDRLISAVLKGLAEKIGDNVTVILDCCHSFGLTRAAMPEGLVARCLDNLPPLMDDTDATFFSGSERGFRGIPLSRCIRGGMSNAAEAPHIMLAACQQDQSAYESATDEQHRGAFTLALLKVFKAENRDNLTYAGVMLHMHMSTACNLQTAASYGTNQDRVIFTTKQGASTKDLYVGRSLRSSDDGPVVFGGLTHGISAGDELFIYNIDTKRTFIGKAKVKACHAVCTVITPYPPIPANRTFYCKVVPKYDQWPVYFDLSLADKLPEVLHSHYTHDPEHAVVVIKPNALDDRFLLSFGKGGDDAMFAESIGHQLLEPVTKDKVMPLLDAMFRFRKLLGTPKSDSIEEWGNTKQSEPAIDVSLHSLRYHDRSDKTDEGILIPRAKETTIASHKTPLGYQAQIEVKVLNPRHTQAYLLNQRKSKLYGFSITNNTETELFAYVICFNVGDLSIIPWYSSSYFTPDVPLSLKMMKNAEGTAEEIGDVSIAGGIHPGQCLDLGSGNSGVEPYRFILPKGLDKDRTFFKVILTTTPADFSMFTQTPLEPKRTKDPSLQRATTSRSPHVMPELSAMIQDGQRVAFEYQRGQFADDYFSAVFCVDQIKDQ